MTARTGRLGKPILVAAIVAVSVAAIGMTITDLGPWYQSLRKPPWQPPDWLFGPAWTLIFGLAALSAATAWRDATNNFLRDGILILFPLNGFFNILWSLLFFRAERPDWAFLEVILLWVSVVMLILYLARFSRVAAWLLAPYLAWVTFAGVLNWKVVVLNAPFG